jgi:hypothetical protein
MKEMMPTIPAPAWAFVAFDKPCLRPEAAYSDLASSEFWRSFLNVRGNAFFGVGGGKELLL